MGMGTPYGVSLAVHLLFCCALMSASAQSISAPAPAPSSPPRNFKWDVEYILHAPDCNQSVMIGINGEFPGPNISANAGDRISVKVTNKLHTEGVVIHWHGIRQIGTPWADGTASISQCPINPGETFTYEFLADKPGTFFYHGHYGMQRAAGLYGSLIVNATAQQPEPFADEYDDGHELSMLLSDWYHENPFAQAAGLEGKGKHWQWVGEPQTILINGRGQFGCSLRPGKTTCNREKRDTLSLCQERGDDKAKKRCELTILRSECGPFCELSHCSPVVFNVDPGKRYRLRIASTTSLSALNVQVQGHKLKLVEADGNSAVSKEPLLDDIDIYSGESYSVILRTDQPASSYWITVGVRGRKRETPDALAILNYTNSNSKRAWPEVEPPETPDWDDVERSKRFTYNIFAGDATPRPPEKADRTIIMLNTQNEVAKQVKWAINHVTLSLPATPYLGAYFYGIEDIVFDNSAEPPDTYDHRYDIWKQPGAQAPAASSPTTVSDRVFRIRYGDVVDVVLQNSNVLNKGDYSESHPWHLHGHDFWVLGYNEGKDDAVYDHDRDYKKLNRRNPPLRNTVVLFPHGWTAIRFVADNPGVWAFHCHIEPHLHLGMGVIFAEGMEKLRELKVPTEAVTCGKAKTAAQRLALSAVAPPPP